VDEANWRALKEAQEATDPEVRYWSVPQIKQYIADGKVVQGKGGWLFLGNDVNDVMSQQSGELTLTDDQLERWQALLEERTRRVADLGASYFFFVVPETHSVYPEKLPDGFVPTTERPVHKLLNRLEQTGSPVRPIYPLDEILAEKSNGLVYTAWEAHWTDFGALVAYTRLMKDVKTVVPVREVDPGEVSYTTRMMPSELRYKLGFEEEVEHLHAVFPVRARLIEDSEIYNHGSYAVLECDEAPPTTCVLFGDSYAMNLLRYLAESFRRLVFAHMLTLDYELIERERPDVVISQSAERFLIQVPADESGITIGEYARQKREASEPSRPRWPWWG
jgi:alginate O-acetyltransferase complex protein AlgJ